MTQDVQMEDAVPGTPKDAEGEKEEEPTGPVLEQVLATNIKLIRKAVATRETRLLFGRLLRHTATVRSQLDIERLSKFVEETLDSESSVKPLLLQTLSSSDEGMNVDASPLTVPDVDASSAKPEEEAYCSFLVCQYLTDQNLFTKLDAVASAVVPYMRALNRRTLDVLAARLVHYFSLARERAGDLQSIRATLLELHNTAGLNHDEFGQEVLLNLLMRNYLHYNLYDQAEKLRAQSQRPEATRSNQQHCRYLFYLGRIRAVQLEYTEAKECMVQAARKAPTVAKGFILIATKWLVVVRLLLGDVPDRVEFQQPGMEAALRPYLDLAAAVRGGDVGAFSAVAETHAAAFAADRVNLLVGRLRFNVIRSGLLRISVSYSRISLKDVAAKLGLSSVRDTESVVAKTIRDGSFSAVLDHENQVLLSKATSDVYVTKEPQEAFHARTVFCMDIHNEAVKAMRYDVGAPAKAERKAEAEASTNEAIAASMVDEEDEF